MNLRKAKKLGILPRRASWWSRGELRHMWRLRKQGFSQRNARAVDRAIVEVLGDGLFRCWCGEVGPTDLMLSFAHLDRTCGGMGILQCSCGGDMCVCHFHGEAPCSGCSDCEGEDDHDYDDPRDADL